MDYEKKYNEALELARDYYKANLKLDKADENLILEDIFPELAESEGDRIRKEILEVAETVVSCDGTLYGKKYNCREWIAWLEKQGDHKLAWSEEDEEILRTIISDGLRGAEFDMLQINWLKSLKQRIGWKPSDEQIQCLYDAIEHYQTNGYPASKLNELYEQMSKIYKL